MAEQEHDKSRAGFPLKPVIRGQDMLDIFTASWPEGDIEITPIDWAPDSTHWLVRDVLNLAAARQPLASIPLVAQDIRPEDVRPLFAALAGEQIGAAQVGFLTETQAADKLVWLHETLHELFLDGYEVETRLDIDDGFVATTKKSLDRYMAWASYHKNEEGKK